MILMIDWGSYLAYDGSCNLPWKLLIEKAGVRVFCTKGDQEDLSVGVSTKKNISYARAEGVDIVGTYYWYYPGLSAQYQIDNYSRAIERENPDFIVLDIEDYMVNGVIKDPERLSEGARTTCEGIKRNFPNLKFLPYTSRNFVINRMPSAGWWLNQYRGNEWVASYLDYGQKVYRLTWEEIKKGDMRITLNYNTGEYVMGNVNLYQPAYPPGWTKYKIWQYSSRIMPPLEDVVNTVYDHQYDWNVIPGTIEEFKAWCGVGVKPPDLEEQIMLLERRIKKLEEMHNI